MQQQIVETNYQQHFEPLLTAEETAIHLRCHLKAVQKMARERRMPSIKRGKRHFFRLNELDDWLRSMQTHHQPTLRVN
jgi:excisionase family DNA binding protein